MKIENKHAEEEKTSERSVKVLLSGIFTRKKKKERSSPPPKEDSSLMRRDKTSQNTHMSLSEKNMTRKLKHSSEKEKPQHDNKMLPVLGKKNGMRISTTKNHLFLQRMTSISQKRLQHHHVDVVKEKPNLSSQNGDSDQRETIRFDEKGMRISTTKNHFVLERMTSISQKRLQNRKHNLSFENGYSSDHNYLAKSVEDAQRRIVSLLPTGYSSPFRSPGKTWDQNSKEIEESAGSLSQDSSPSVSKHFVTFEISQLRAYHHVEKEKESSHEERLIQPSLISVDEYKLVLEPLFIGYEIIPARGEAKRQTLCNQFEEKDVPKASVFKYVKAVLDAIDSSSEEMYLKTELSDQILNPALFSKIPFYPSQLCAVDHGLLFDSINELIFELCRFPPWASFVKPIRTQVFSFSDESIVHEVQKEVYCRLFPLQFAHSVGQIMREDMDKRGNWWLDIRCEVECIGFETSELILNELLEQLILDL